jgi:hypothetical protein
VDTSGTEEYAASIIRIEVYSYAVYEAAGSFEPFAFTYNTIRRHYSGDCTLIFQKFRRPYIDTETTKTSIQKIAEKLTK